MQPQPEQTFWMICRMPAHPRSETKPQQRYPSYLAACQAARQMSGKTGHHYGVLTLTDVFAPTSRLTDHGLF
tara:strand:+ start:127 stop:342 length:216 start_codon:yes stop_codon:yes gene_type:complete